MYVLLYSTLIIVNLKDYALCLIIFTVKIIILRKKENDKNEITSPELISKFSFQINFYLVNLFSINLTKSILFINFSNNYIVWVDTKITLYFDGTQMGKIVRFFFIDISKCNNLLSGNIYNLA